MRRLRSSVDPIDAVLGDSSPDDDLADVAAIVHDLRSAYVPEDALAHVPALAAFTGRSAVSASTAAVAADAVIESPPARPSRRSPRRVSVKALSAVSGFVATLTGKVVLGTAVAAAGVGGLQAADVIDVPGMPEVVQAPREGHLRDFGGGVAEDAREDGVEGADVAAAPRATPDVPDSTRDGDPAPDVEIVEPPSVERPLPPARPDRPDKAQHPDKPGKPDKAAKPDKPGKAVKPDKPGKAVKPDKPGKAVKPDKPGKAAKPDQPGTPDKAGRPDKPDNATAGNRDWGARVSADARDGGVDGPEIAEHANDHGQSVAADPPAGGGDPGASGAAPDFAGPGGASGSAPGPPAGRPGRP